MNWMPHPLLLWATLGLLACSSGGARPPGADLSAVASDQGTGADSGESSGDGGGGDLAAGSTDAGADLRAPSDLSTTPDLWSGVLDVRILVSNTCVVTTNPPSFGVSAGQTFTVNWINLAASASNVDIAKIDMFNQVPIVLGLEPGMSYHDAVRPWCGIFTGMFSFRVTGCDKPYYMPIDCNKP
jgi:hypothetical protein